MQDQENKVGLVIITVVRLGIIDNNGKKKDRASDQPGKDCAGKFIESGFLIQGVIGSGKTIKNYPAKRNQDDAIPETVVQKSFPSENIFSSNRYRRVKYNTIQERMAEI